MRWPTSHPPFSVLWIVAVLQLAPATGVQSGNDPCPVVDSKGTEFVVAFMETMTPSVDPRLFIIGASARSTRVTIRSPRDADITVSISHESRVKVVREEGPSTAAVLVTADREVTVYGVEEGNSMDSFLVLPTDALGTEYYVVSYGISDRLQRDHRKSQFTLLGVLDGTTVEVTLSGTVEHEGRRYWSGERIRVTLDRLQVVHFASADDDLTGTRIVASKKIGVLSGSQCADVPVNMRFCDHLVEMLPPVKSWGRAFITTPLYGRTSGDAFRIVAARDDTTVTVSSYGRATLHAGEFFEIEIGSNASRSITADRPLLVMQYSLGGDADQTTGDPFMMLVPALEQFTSNAVFYTVDSSSNYQLTDYANVVIECRDVRGLEHNLFEIPESSFGRLDRLRHTLDGREYCMAQMVLARGVHFLRHSKPETRFSLSLYGMGVNQADIAYGMPAGLRLLDHTCRDSVTDADTSTPSTQDANVPTQRDRTVAETPGQNAVSPAPGPSVNGTPAQSSGTYLTLAVFVALFSLATIFVLVVYIVVLRRRIRRLEAERKVYSRMQLSPVVVGADGYIGLDGSQHPERDYMTLNNPQGVWRLGRVRRTGRAPGGVPYVANVAVNTNSNGISHISDPTLVPSSRGSAHGAAAAGTGGVPPTFNRISVDSNHALRFSRRSSSSSNDALSCVSSGHGSTGRRNSTPAQSHEGDGATEKQNGACLADAGGQVARKHSFQELHDIAECPDKEPPPRPNHLVRSVSQPSYQASLKVNAPKVYYSVPKNGRGRTHYDHPRRRSSSAEEPCPVIFSMKELLLKHDDGYMSMRDHRTSVSSQGSSNLSVISGSVVLPTPDTTPYSFVPDEAQTISPDSAETDSTDYTELF